MATEKDLTPQESAKRNKTDSGILAFQLAERTRSKIRTFEATTPDALLSTLGK